MYTYCNGNWIETNFPGNMNDKIGEYNFTFHLCILCLFTARLSCMQLQLSISARSELKIYWIGARCFSRIASHMRYIVRKQGVRGSVPIYNSIRITYFHVTILNCYFLFYCTIIILIVMYYIYILTVHKKNNDKLRFEYYKFRWAY